MNPIRVRLATFSKRCASLAAFLAAFSGTAWPQTLVIKQMFALSARIRESYDEATADALFATFVRNGTWQCPMLAEIRGQIDDPLVQDDSRLPCEGLVGHLHGAGVKILAGTDTMNPQAFPGFGLHDELALLVDSGLPPSAALQAATRNAAQFISQQDGRGTIGVVQIADLVLLGKNPLPDIHNTRSIRAVVLGGKVLSRSALDAISARARLLAGSPDAGGPTKRN